MPDNLREKYHGGNHIQNGEKELTYLFEIQEEKKMATKIRTGIWQIFPSVCASLTCIPFGLMLGWPSPTYPRLLTLDSPVPITLDQSAMVAGSLMIGTSFGTIFSRAPVRHGTKYGIILGNVFILLGWIIMWHAQNIYGLVGSRILLGSGYGYAAGQIKSYIIEMTEDSQSVLLLKHLNFYGNFGILLAFLIGPFVDFRQFSLVSLIISVFVLFLAIFLPSTPRELIRAEKIEDAKRLLLFLKPNINADQETYEISQRMSEKNERHGFTHILRNKTLRTNFIKLTVLLVCQQYCGVPPTLIYTQIIFAKTKVPYPEYIALVYALLFFLSSIIGAHVIPRYNKKTVLLISSCSVFVLYVSMILVLYFNINEGYFIYSSVIVMYLFIVAHTVGFAIIPFTLINSWFPTSYQVFVTKYFIILFFLLALSVTKIFQVLLGEFPMYVPFCLFTGVIVFAIIFISIFIPFDISPKHKDVYTLNIVKSRMQMPEKK